MAGFYTARSGTFPLLPWTNFAPPLSDGAGLVEIEVKLNGELGRNPANQLQLVLSGEADMAFIVAGYIPDALPDHRLMELPGLFENQREASLVHARLAQAGMLRGLEDVKVLGAFAASPESFHARKPVTSLDDLQGAKVRVNNVMQARMLEELGMIPTDYPITEIATGLSRGEIDAALLPPGPLVEFGVARIATNHFMLKTTAIPLVIVMNRAVYESLPAEVQTIIDNAGGERVAEHAAATSAEFEADVMAGFRANPRRTVTEPSEADLEQARAVFDQIIDDWSRKDPRNSELLDFVETELAKIRQE